MLKMRKTKLTIFIAVISIALFGVAGIANAAEYYVSPTGAAVWASCGGATPLNGTAACSPQTTMTNAVAGDIVYFRGGDYYPPNVSGGTGDASYPAWYPTNDGTATNPITLKAYAGEIPYIYQPTGNNSAAGLGAGRNSYIIFDGFTFIKTRQYNAGGTWRCESSDHITIKNSTFIGNEVLDSQNQVGLYNTNCDDLEIYNNLFRDFTGDVNGGAMWLLGGLRSLVHHNTFSNMTNAIQTKGSANGISSYNNFFMNVVKTFHWQQQWPGIKDFLIYNNVSVNIPSGGYFFFAQDPANAYDNN